MKCRSLLEAAIAASLALAAGSVHANLLTNGSFETPVVPVGFYTNFAAGSTAITGWTVVGVDSAVTSGTFTQNGITFNAQNGVQWIDLAGITSNSTASGVTQTIVTVAGSTYEISFYVGSTSDNAQFFPSTVDLSVNGGPRQSFTNAITPPPRTSVDWARFVYDFTASGGSTTITFFNGSAPNNFFGGLDNASVDLVRPGAVGVPEPHEIALFGLGLSAMLALRRSREGRSAA